jgi:hypothetical protein
VLASCSTTRYVPVVEHRTDTLRITQHQRDSIWLHDSIHIVEKLKGDTLLIQQERWHTRYVDRLQMDTVYVATHDTVPQIVPAGDPKADNRPKLERIWDRVLYFGFGVAVVVLFLIFTKRRR